MPDDSTKKSKLKPNNIRPFQAPKGNVKGIGKLGIYTGGLSPLVVSPQPGLAPRRVAPAIFRGYGTDSRSKNNGKH